MTATVKTRLQTLATDASWRRTRHMAVSGFKGTAKHGSKGYLRFPQRPKDGKSVEFANWGKIWSYPAAAMTLCLILSSEHKHFIFIINVSCSAWQSCAQKACPHWVARAFQLGWSHPAQRASAQVRVALMSFWEKIQSTWSLALQLSFLIDLIRFGCSLRFCPQPNRSKQPVAWEICVQLPSRRLIDSWQSRHGRFELLCVMLLLLEKQIAYDRRWLQMVAAVGVDHLSLPKYVWKLCQKISTRNASVSLSLSLSFATMPSTASERTDLFSGFSKSIFGKSACFLAFQYHPI